MNNTTKTKETIKISNNIKYIKRSMCWHRRRYLEWDIKLNYWQRELLKEQKKVMGEM